MEGRRAEQSECQAREIESKELSTDGLHKIHQKPKRTATCRNCGGKESCVVNVVSAITLVKFAADSQNLSRMTQNQGENILKNRSTQ